jgi:hypothetical protein
MWKYEVPWLLWTISVLLPAWVFFNAHSGLRGVRCSTRLGQTADGGVDGHHGGSRGVAGAVGVEAAEDRVARPLSQAPTEPSIGVRLQETRKIDSRRRIW